MKFNARQTNPYEHYAGDVRFNNVMAGGEMFISTYPAFGGNIMRFGNFPLNTPDPNDHVNFDGFRFGNSDWQGRIPAEQNLAFAGSDYYQELMFPFEDAIGGVL
jgi:hypothetical protein